MTEHQIQTSSIPNSTFTTSWNQKARNKNSGLRAGLPDLIILIQGKPYFIEMKKETGSVQDNQKLWLQKLNSKEITAFVACSLQEVELIIEDILEQNETKNSKYFSQNLKGAKFLSKIMEF